MEGGLTTPNLRAFPGMRIPIRLKLTVPYLLLSVVIALAAAYLITQVVIDNIHERFTKQLFEAGKISSELIVGYESNLLETQRLLSNATGVPAAMGAHDPEQLRALTLGIIANNRQETVEFVDAGGGHLLSIHHRPGANPEDYDVSTGAHTTFSSLPIVLRVLGQSSDPRGDKFADLVHTDAGDFVYVAGPVYDEGGGLAGAALVGRSLETIAGDLRIKTFGQVSLYDRSGRLVYGTLPFPHDLPPEIAATLLSGSSAGSLTRDMDVAELSYSEILGPWNVRGDHNLGVLGVALSQNSVVQTSGQSRWRIFLLVAAANFLIILVGINLANAITRPLLRLVQASARVAGGDLNVKVQPRSNDEVTVLTESFNSMVESLNYSQKQLIRSYDDTLKGWAKALEMRDKETEGHSERVTELTLLLAEAMGIEGEALVNVRRGALLHDIGKMGTPDAVLNKPGPLDESERRIIEKHPTSAYEMLRHIEHLRPALDIPYCHHEKWDGSGYPRGLKGEEIPLAARIFSVVDVYDALMSDRPYRKAMSLTEVVAYLRSQSGRHFDPQVLETFLRVLGPLGRGLDAAE